MDKRIIAYCSYCHNPIFENESYIKIGNVYYHYNKTNPLENCYFEDNLIDEYEDWEDGE